MLKKMSIRCYVDSQIVFDETKKEKSPHSKQETK